MLWAVDLAGGRDVLIDLGQRLGLAAPPPLADGVERTRAAARVALRLVLAGHIGIEAAHRPFAVARDGKPFVQPRDDGAAIEFSLAHCEAAAVIAVSRDGPVGIDVEAPRRVRISADRRGMLLEAARSLAPEAALPEGPGEAQFLQAWVRLEALAKATGEGLGALLGRLGDAASPLAATQVNGTRVRVRDLGLTGVQLWAAVAGTNSALEGDATPTAVWLPLDADRLEQLWRREPGGGRPSRR